MDFAFGEEQQLLRGTTRGFLDKHHPIGALRPVLELPDKVDREVWRAGAELGWTAMLVPEEHDGGSITEQPLIDLVAICEELGRVLYPGPVLSTNVVADVVVRWGSESQRKELLGPIARGESIAAWCVSGNGTAEPAAVEVRASRTGGSLILDGRAGYVLGAAEAEVLLVSALDGDGLLHVLVPTTAPGLEVRVMAGLDLTRTLAEVSCKGVEVAVQGVVGTRDDGLPIMTRALEVATVLQAADAVGAAEYLFEVTVDYLKDRVQFGRPIGSFQAIKHRLANMKIQVESMRAAAHYAALALADGFDDAAAAVSTAGSYVGDAFASLCGEALQLHGGIGFTWEHDVHLFVRRARVDQVLFAEPAWHRERLCVLTEAAVTSSRSTD